MNSEMQALQANLGVCVRRAQKLAELAEEVVRVTARFQENPQAYIDGASRFLTTACLIMVRESGDLSQRLKELEQ